MSVTPMIYYKHNNFVRSVHELYQQDGDYRRSAMIALAIMAKSQEGDIFNDSLIIDKLNKVSVTSISGKLYQVYDLQKSCRLVVATKDQEKILLFAGDTKKFNEWRASILKEKPTFEKTKQDSRQLSTITVEMAAIEESDEFNFDDFIKNNPDSVEAKIKQAIDMLIIQSSNNKESRKKLRQSIQQYRQDIKEYYNLLEHQNSTDYDANLNDETTIISEIDKVITIIEKKHHTIVTNRVEDTFSFIKSHQLQSGLDATQKLKDEVEFVEIKVKYTMALENLVDNMKIGIALSEKTKLINDVVNENLVKDDIKTNLIENKKNQGV
ncbi:hypothetical protein RCF98_09695 [Thiothrix lacustris]|uniref:Bro-N domain-containing protein n=1 Tax=Thiothrix lacustris TaxID=525917 RepID=A0ABY9MKX0_9GAMM|nr:hypothetical protein [Thiothrix lacustris]WML89246.1 hypothetical protein RCF98_09695 [Thiothrix lacustris]